MKVFTTFGLTLFLSISIYAQNWEKIGKGGIIGGTIYQFYEDNKSGNLFIIGGISQVYEGDSANGVVFTDGYSLKSLKSLLNTQGFTNTAFAFIRFNGDFYLSKIILFDSIAGQISFQKLESSSNNWIFDTNYNLNNGAARTFKEYNKLLYIGGAYITKCGNDSTASVCTFNGNQLTSLVKPKNGFYTGHDVAIFDIEFYKNRLYVAGNFNFINTLGESINDFAYIENGEFRPTGFSGGFAGFVQDMEIFQDELYLTGYFTQMDGMPSNHIAIWNGNQFLPVGNGLDNEAYSLYSNNDVLYVGGRFDYADSYYSPRIVAWKSNEWTPIHTDTFMSGEYVSEIIIYKSELYIGGTFQTINDDSVRCLAKYAHQLPGDENNLDVWFNNVNNEIIVQYENNITYDIHVNLMSINGQTIQEFSFPNLQGYTHQQIPVPGLASGVYVVVVFAGNKVGSKKIVKV